MATVDHILNKLIAGGQGYSALTTAEIKYLCASCTKVIEQQPILLELRPPLIVCGDVHGQYIDLLNIFNNFGFPPRTNYLFLGDIVDRGPQSIETICLLMALKIKHPKTFFMIRGNHEDDVMTQKGGFLGECKTRFAKSGLDIWRTVCDMFEWMPLMALINGRIACMHAGLSPDLNDLDQVRSIKRPLHSLHSGIARDLVWSDPRDNLDHDFVFNSERGTSYYFSSDYVKRFLRKFDLDLVVRAHECQDKGYSFCGEGLLTIFSAPNYCGKGNKAAVLAVDEHLKCTIKTFGLKFFGVSTEVNKEDTPPH